jgi:hypothetical protein
MRNLTAAGSPRPGTLGAWTWAESLLLMILSAARLQYVGDWATLADLATGAGTLVLAIATFGAVRSANRAARVAEASLLAGTRPVLMNSRLQDPKQKVAFVDDVWLAIPGGQAAVSVTDEAIHLAVSLRNAGTGMGILHGWRLRAGRQAERTPPPLADFTPQGRDMYVAPAEMGFWQGALRDPGVPLFDEVASAVKGSEMLTLDLLYGDLDGGQRVISRFYLQGRTEGGAMIASVVRHWNVDRPNPR